MQKINLANLDIRIFTLLLLFSSFLLENDKSLISQIFASNSSNSNIIPVSINNSTVLADIADSAEEQSKGLSIKDNMSESNGMIFVFEDSKKHSFWMKDMKFSIDIIWINENKEIVHIEKNLQPCHFLGPCPSFSPDKDSSYVLEVVSNFTNKNDIKIGDKVLFDIQK